MKKVNFTAERVAGFKCDTGKQQLIFWDGKTPGLGVRVTRTGIKSYIFESRLHGKTLRITVGDVRSWPIGKAQSEAARLKVLIDQGIDPRQQKAQQRAQAEAAQLEAERETVTVGDAWPLYLEAHRETWSALHYRDHLVLSSPGGEEKKRGKGKKVPGPLVSISETRLCDLTSNEIAAWLERESANRPTATALSFRLLRAFIRWTNDVPAYRGLVPADVHKARIVRQALPRPQTKEGDCLQREQLPLWFDAVRKICNPVISAYLQALLFTGARRGEMAALRWCDVDFQWRSLTIRDKVDGTRIIPLPPYLASLLAMLPRRNEWVFSSPTAIDGRLSEPRAAHTSALIAAGLPHVSLHGLRRSFGTLCEWVEMPAGISAQIMGHKPSALAEKHYRRRPLDLLRMWHDKIEGWILDQASISFETKQSNYALRAVK